MLAQSKPRVLKLDDSGQSTVEFALTLVFLLALVLFFLQLSMVFAYGSFAHYATFMASRAYLSAGFDRQDQESRSRQVLVEMLKRSQGSPGVDRWVPIAQGVGGADPQGINGARIGFASDLVGNAQGDRRLSWLDGVRYTFRSRILLLPLGGDTPSGDITLTSESWLTRDPSFEECRNHMEVLRGSTGNKGLFDNGC